MEKQVLLTIVSTQKFMSEEPEKTELVTDGTLSVADGAVVISYKESELTGLQGTTTTFRVEDKKVTLERKGAVESKMSFEVGQEDRSLYDMGFGALMITIRTERLQSDLTEQGGEICVAYAITIEEQSAGWIEYRIDVRLK